MNPQLVLDDDKPRLIDEWQEVPGLWDAVRGQIDETSSKGQYILTDSASINKDKYIHSGTGRISRIRMRPMSLYESNQSSCIISLNDICNNKTIDKYIGDIDLNSIIKYILVGGWPSSIDLKIDDGIIVSKEYVKSVINEDIFKVNSIKRDKNKIELLLKSLARNESTTVTNLTLKKDIIKKDYDDVNIDTISDYLNLFNSIYITENIPPYSFKIRSSLRLKQRVKRHFVDPSIPSALLNLSVDKLINDLESLVYRDLLTYVDSFNAKLYHYQDYKNNEIDAIIELEDGSWCGIEIKLGANQIDDAAKNLLKINQLIIQNGMKGAKSLIVICGLTNAAYMRPDGVYVVPITALKD